MTCTIAFYLRYSCDKQSETSIDDQLRRCNEIAKKLGLPTENALTFSDDALSATGKDDARRSGYRELLAAWDANQFTVLIVDEWSRLTREVVEHALIIKRLEQNRRVRLVSGDGIDTDLPNWQMAAGFVGMVSQQSTRDTRWRVERGMVGQLKRGYMVAMPAFGYDLKRKHDDDGKIVGSHWIINEKTAAVVREIFARRENGESMHQIANWLNDSGVPTSRGFRQNASKYWRAARIRNLLSNPIYRGIFIWHGSASYQTRAEKMGIKYEVLEFSRPHLRLVSDETWHRCNSAKSISRSGYGGGKNALAGVVTCGCCGSTLVLTCEKSRRSLYCASCTEAKASGGDKDRQTSTVGAIGVQLLLTEALRHFLKPAFLGTFRESLRLKLTGDNRHELDQCKNRLRQLEKQQVFCSRFVVNDPDDLIMKTRYVETRRQVREAQARLKELENANPKVDEQALEAQLAVDPGVLIDILADANVPPERLRVMLSRLFPSIVFAGKSDTYTSFFKIDFAAGEALSLASGTASVEGGTVTQYFELRYMPAHRTKGRWTVSVVTVAAMPNKNGETRARSLPTISHSSCQLAEV